MLKIQRQQKTLAPLDTTLADVAISERYDLQEYICNSHGAFFREIGQELFLVGKEIVASDNVDDRIDVLALDKDGDAVIIELKRGSDKLQMLQAISYAGMISKWTPDRFREEMNKFDTQAWEKLDDWLDIEDKESINRRQRIILIAEAFDYSLLAGAEWLSEQFDVRIICCRLAVAHDAATSTEFLFCSNVFPLPELAQQALKRGRARGVVGTASKRKYFGDWPMALANIGNPSILAYFKREVEAKREGNFKRCTLFYRQGGKRRWWVTAKPEQAYVWQYSRFGGDQEHWKKHLSLPAEVVPVKEARGLRFRLATSQDCEFFHKAATEALASVVWENTVTDDDDGEDEAP